MKNKFIFFWALIFFSASYSTSEESNFLFPKDYEVEKTNLKVFHGFARNSDESSFVKLKKFKQFNKNEALVTFETLKIKLPNT